MPLIHRITASQALACLLLVSPCISAEPAGTEEAEKPSMWATPASMQGVLPKLLERADANGDAHVSTLELQRFVLEQVLIQIEKRVSKLDRNADGQITSLEVPHMPADRFARFDMNGNGALTLWELAQYMREQALRRCRTAFLELDADKNGALSMRDVAPHEEAQRLATASD